MSGAGGVSATGVALNLKAMLQTLKPALEASLDAVAMVDSSNRLVYANVAMRGLLGVSTQQLKKAPVFCDLLKLSVCVKSCEILGALKSGETLRLDETPASRRGEKLRVLLKAVPLFDLSGSDSKSATKPVGALISVRDTTGEVLLQAKYHKILQMLADKEEQITDLLDRLNTLRGTLRRARGV
jgi:hypothetical protein